MNKPKLSEEGERLLGRAELNMPSTSYAAIVRADIRDRMAYLESRVAELEAANEDQSDEVLAKYHATLVTSGYYNRAQADNSAEPRRE